MVTYYNVYNDDITILYSDNLMIESINGHYYWTFIPITKLQVDLLYLHLEGY